MIGLKLPLKRFSQVVLPRFRRRPPVRSRAKPRGAAGPFTQNRVLIGAKVVTEFLSVGRTLVLDLALLVVSGVLVLMLWKAATSTSITVRPIPVPEALSKRGYTPAVFAARVAAEIAHIDREAQTVMPRQHIVGSEDQPLDIQIPGQPVSFRTLVHYIKELFGIEDIAVSIDVTEDKGDYIAQIRIIGGAYDGSLETVSSPISDNTDAHVLTVAKTAIHAAAPGILASYEIGVEEARCGQSSSCKFVEALALFDEMLTKPPLQDDKWALAGRGYVLWKLGRYEEAIENYQEATELDPKFIPALINWGNALRDLGRPEEAIEKYRKATELAPKHATAYCNWINLLKSLGRQKEADEKYKLIETLGLSC
jgi:hypothetical protein